MAKRLTVSYSLCPYHKAKAKKKNTILWSVFSLSIVLIIIGNILTGRGTSMGSGLLSVGIFMFFILILIAIFLPRVIAVKKIKHAKNLQSNRPYVFYLCGIDQRFVDKANIARATEIKV